MSIQEETSNLSRLPGREPLDEAIEMLIDALNPDESFREKFLLFRKELIASSNGEKAEPSETISTLATLIAQNNLAQQQRHFEFRELTERIALVAEQMERTLVTADVQAQAAYQGIQKAGQVLERQLRDINYRLKTATSMESMKLWLQQRLAIIQARLDDYESLSSQQQTGVSGQLHKLTRHLQELDEDSIKALKQIPSVSQSSFVDRLTKIDNRLGYEAAVNGLLQRSGGSVLERSFLLLLDIDRLNQINSQYGTEAGDVVIQHVARRLRGDIGSGDYLARVGSDRFGVLLLDSATASAHQMAERVCTSIENSSFEFRSSSIRTTVSCGYSQLHRNDDSMAIYQRAERALFSAKEAGGNCCWFDDY